MCIRDSIPTLALLFLLAPAIVPASAAEIWSDEEARRSISLDSALKSSSLLSYAPDDPALFPDRSSAAGLLRFRLSLSARHNEWVNSEIAYEHRARLVSENAGMGTGQGILPSDAPAPFRIRQLDWELLDYRDTFSHRHEVDRALLALHPEWGEVIIGRQAIGLGRGALFSAVDIFAPFTPLEVDREWRRGVDAARVEHRLSDTTSLEALAAFGESWDESALVGRARGYVGSVDGELIFGKRAEDTMWAGTMSAAAGGAELHLEIALFDTPESQPDGGLFGNDHLVGKAVLGSSYTFDLGNGLTLLGEYHYSGFGVKDMADAMDRLEDPTFQERFLRGDTQILGRHALALQSTYPLNDVWTSSMMILQSPADGSGVAAPSLTARLSQNATLILSGFIPWGDEPSGGQLESEYGATPASLFLQLNLYY